MTLHEIADKLAQIQEQAALTVSEYPGGLAIERQNLIIALVRQLRSHIEDDLRRELRVAVDTAHRAPSSDAQ